MKILLILVSFISFIWAERIVTLSPSINEIVFALGEGKNIVANTTYCNYPSQSKEIKKVGGYANISLEKILEVKPTLVIAQNYDQKLLENLKALNIKTLVFKTDTLDSIKNTILTLGKEFNKEKLASSLVMKINQSLKNLENIVSDKKIVIVIHPSKNLSKNIFIVGNNLYFNDIIKASNNQNAYISKNSAQPVVNIEKIIAMNPDIIILLAAFFQEDKEGLAEIKKQWKNLPINAAIKNNIYAIDKEYAGIPSHRVIYFIDDFKKILEDVRNK
ncbi:iron ABC transporter substrate-binding protein [Malaciobacter mytili]|uniref:ABC transporter substrate-binding protein n=1 Tax=Malaciobacter mytili TaxID=603050 RepID=UPI00100C11F3|nr:helical backbone metal receptor [Malaciobacter mytili]RXI37908.1 iron ABC transporter substrate-binding protein [Malaciobacter mytili]